MDKPVYTRDYLADKIVDGNYKGPRGECIFEGKDGKQYDAFICHGCQSCWVIDWEVDPENGVLYDTGPHFLALKERTK